MQLCQKKLFAHGKHAIIYTAILGNKKVIIKQQRSDTNATNIAQKEAKWLKIVNKKNIGPTLLFFEENYTVYEFVDGDFIPEWTQKHSKKEILKILDKILKQCYELDKLQITKEEMHHPYKHIIIKKNPVLIDFERAKKTMKPQNVTQFCQYLISGAYKEILSNRGIKFDKQKTKRLTQEYKKNFKREILTKDLL